jgi:Ca2+-transporting ATPase
MQGGEIYFVKGAIERLVKQCTTYSEYGVPKPMTAKKEEEILTNAYDLGRQGLRVLGMAKGTSFQNLMYVGLVGMQDPPRPSVRSCIQTLLASGIQVKMLTGDAQETALSIARMVGMDVVHGSSISGPEMDKMDEIILEQMIPQINIFYRVAPKHKLKIVKVGVLSLFYFPVVFCMIIQRPINSLYNSGTSKSRIHSRNVWRWSK